MCSALLKTLGTCSRQYRQSETPVCENRDRDVTHVTVQADGITETQIQVLCLVLIRFHVTFSASYSERLLLWNI